MKIHFALFIATVASYVQGESIKYLSYHRALGTELKSTVISAHSQKPSFPRLSSTYSPYCIQL